MSCGRATGAALAGVWCLTHTPHACVTVRAPQLFLREMPVPVLSHVPVDTMLEVDSPSAAQAAAAMVRQPERDVLSFCVHLLALVAQRSRVNKMTPKNCGALPAS